MNAAKTHALDRCLDRLFHWLDAPLVKQAAGEVARECRPALAAAVCRKARGMSRPQARGYVRALVPELVAEEIDIMLERRRIDSSLRSRIVAEAIAQLIDAVVGDVFSVQPGRAAAAFRKAA